MPAKVSAEVKDASLRLDNISFVVNRGKPLVESFLKVQQTDVPTGSLQHYAAALSSVHSNRKNNIDSDPKDLRLISDMEQKYPNIKSFRDWYYDWHVRS